MILAPQTPHRRNPESRYREYISGACPKALLPSGRTVRNANRCQPLLDPTPKAVGQRCAPGTFRYISVIDCMCLPRDPLQTQLASGPVGSWLDHPAHIVNLLLSRLDSNRFASSRLVSNQASPNVCPSRRNTGGRIMTTRTFAFATIGIAALLLPASAGAVGSLSRADFERCSEQAMQAAGVAGSQAPSASPSLSRGSGGASASSSGTGGTAGQSGTSSTGSSIGSTGGSTGTSGGASSAPSTSDTTGSSRAPSNSSASGTTGAGATSGASSSGSSGGGSTTLSGSGDQQQLDKAVQAYRACLQK